MSQITERAVARNDAGQIDVVLGYLSGETDILPQTMLALSGAVMRMSDAHVRENVLGFINENYSHERSENVGAVAMGDAALYRNIRDLSIGLCSREGQLRQQGCSVLETHFTDDQVVQDRFCPGHISISSADLRDWSDWCVRWMARSASDRDDWEGIRQIFEIADDGRDHHSRFFSYNLAYRFILATQNLRDDPFSLALLRYILRNTDPYPLSNNERFDSQEDIDDNQSSLFVRDFCLDLYRSSRSQELRNSALAILAERFGANPASARVFGTDQSDSEIQRILRDLARSPSVFNRRMAAAGLGDLSILSRLALDSNWSVTETALRRVGEVVDETFDIGTEDYCDASPAERRHMASVLRAGRAILDSAPPEHRRRAWSEAKEEVSQAGRGLPEMMAGCRSSQSGQTSLEAEAGADD